ncbi:hypothetical protein CO046_05090 [Candidatus Peregrinibacteria bacterium CG_4_9_14_0_2_um_filter_53_11]|nr:MAG: hypothetical protein CO046_05090 [Candidatus Peregrinibacteria bacterium CG_4_9_14_0_2_um_filter_53_11]
MEGGQAPDDRVVPRLYCVGKQQPEEKADRILESGRCDRAALNVDALPALERERSRSQLL